MHHQKLNVLLVGSGGREHAMAWKIAQSPRLGTLYVAPGNAGMVDIATCVPVNVTDIDGLLQLARDKQVDLTVVGPEAPLTLGIVDRFRQSGLAIFGPSKEAARLEGSKAFAKEVMIRCGVPTARSRAFTDPAEARAYLNEFQPPYVIKADGLAAGKGVVIAPTLAEAERAIHQMMEERVFGAAGAKVVVEEFLDGEEASFLAFTDGTHIVPMVPAQDHKRVFDGDRGPNTGGMGAYSPAPVMTEALCKEAMEKVMRPVVKGMNDAGIPFSGILYAGLMMTPAGMRVLEFNCRFGDPETQPILMRLDSDLLTIFELAAAGRLDRAEVKWSDDAAVCVVMAGANYPATSPKGEVINGLADAEQFPGVQVFHGGTARRGQELVTAGGRVLGVTARAGTLKKAIDLAYNAVGCIHFNGAHYRRDIGAKAARHGAV